jgi:molybdopterin-guanine dinucleotide biosynthesis protein A
VPSGCAGLLLTGGASRRLGVDKAGVLVDGARLADRSAGLLTSVCDPVLELGPGASGLPAVLEEPRGAGPLAALVAGADALDHRGWSGPVLLLAVDLPRLSAAAVAVVARHPTGEIVVPVVDGVAQVTCARYGRQALDAARSLVGSGQRSLRSLLEEVGFEALPDVVWADLGGAALFDDLDTVEDARRLGIELHGLPHSTP